MDLEMCEAKCFTQSLSKCVFHEHNCANLKKSPPKCYKALTHHFCGIVKLKINFSAQEMDKRSIFAE